MRLEIEKTTVRHLGFGSRTILDNGELTINREELVRLLGEDKRLQRIDVEIALPGENCRIMNVVDVIEPRAKFPTGPPSDAPDDLHPPIGEGRVRALKGMAVVMSDCRKKENTTLIVSQIGSNIDMTGPVAALTPFGRTCNLVLTAVPRPGLSVGEYQIALKQAALKCGAYLASATFEHSPEETVVYDLPALTGIPPEHAHLPKVVYIPQIFSLQFVPIPGEPILFGRQADGIVPSLLHPNQILDGAVTSAYPGMHMTTYDLQNSPIVQTLFQRHGRDLNFCGVIVTLAPNNVSDFDNMAELTASLAKSIVGADGAILTKCGGGAPELAMACTARKCEQFGIKTVVAMLNLGADVKDHKYGATTIFNFKEVDAMVSMGSPYAEVVLPAVEKVIGRPEDEQDNTAANGEITTGIGMIKGAMCQLGSSKLTAVRY